MTNALLENNIFLKFSTKNKTPSSVLWGFVANNSNINLYLTLIAIFQFVISMKYYFKKSADILTPATKAVDVDLSPVSGFCSVEA